MFGEDDFDEAGPRSNSPWDVLISTPPSVKAIPKLVPEVEEGNVEYKLQLLSPSPARFARLVTQLKWRLLEGGGQAYYEIGVADSGALVGLPRAELEQSIETLEMMAGEIGASVIIIKEVEVPAIMMGKTATTSTSVKTNVDHGPCNVRNGTRRLKMASFGSLASSVQSRDSDDALGSTTEAETDSRDASATDLTDFEEEQLSESTEAVLISTDEAAGIAVFSMDLELDEDRTESIPLEINEVYKPRPHRVRAPLKQMASHHTEKRGSGPKPPRRNPDIASPLPGDRRVRNSNKRFARDKNRDAKRQALLTQVQVSLDLKNDPKTNKDVPNNINPHDSDEAAANELAQQLEGLSVSVERADPHEVVCAPLVDADQAPHNKSDVIAMNNDLDLATVASVTTATAHISNNDRCEPRLIVEALVVRKLSIQEAFLDFGGFSLM